MRRSSLIVLLAVSALALSACGSATYDTGAEPEAGELVGLGMVMQRSADAPAEFCMGAVATSYPPQCSGPQLVGAFSWDDVHAEEHDGVRWTNDSYYGVGTYDAAANAFALTRPLRTSPPEGFTVPAVEDRGFPQLCDDPFRGGDPDYEDPDLTIQNTFQERLETLPGYVESWVSDGARMFNVIVTGDAEEAHAALREIWPGGLCVEQRDAPTAVDVAAASDALGEHAEELGLYGWGGQGTFDVSVVLADEATVARIHEILSPWLTPEQVTVTGALQPLPESSATEG
ncbi:MAG TPA: hypothetical protein GXZ60_13150 [Intrasporangiaceae bacterium]|nr:hypothetical protein [Intrasporangiaceae bacterium]